MSEIYLVTGGAGHLGNTLVHTLAAMGKKVRALVLPEDSLARYLKGKVEIYYGDVRDKESLRPFFSVEPCDKAIVIHAAGIVTIASKFNQAVKDVNVGGTRNILELCRETGVAKLVHVSSVHAIQESRDGQMVAEADHFDPEKVVGLYAKTKAEATQLVLDAAKEGLNASVVHPSGICGPFDYGNGHLTQLLIDYCNRRLTAGIRGGYDFVDVRDVAAGIITCCEKGKPGECYILSNRYFTIAEMFDYFYKATGGRKIKTILPMWFAKLTAPLSEMYYKILKQTPLYTAYSLYTLCDKSGFTHEKADRELGYHTRAMDETIKDTVNWLEEQGRIQQPRIRT